MSKSKKEQAQRTTKSKQKFLDFEGNTGVQCICGSLGAFIACEIHLDYPKLTKDHKVRVPVCDDCRIICDECTENNSTYFYIDKLQKRRMKDLAYRREQTAKKKLKKKITLTSGIKKSLTEDELLADMSSLPLEDALTDHYKQVAINNLSLVFAQDLGTQLGTYSILKTLEEVGIQPEFSLSKYSSKLLSLVYLLLQIRSLGLSSFEDKIMNSAIEQLFGNTAKLTPNQLSQLLQRINKDEK